MQTEKHASHTTIYMKKIQETIVRSVALNCNHQNAQPKNIAERNQKKKLNERRNPKEEHARVVTVADVDG